MATFKNVSGGPLDIPALDLHIPAAGTFTVDDTLADGFRAQPAWEEITTKITPGITPATPAAIPGPVALAVPPIAPALPTDAPAVVTEIGA